MNLPRTYRVAAKFGITMALLFAGVVYGPNLWVDSHTGHFQYIYWLAVTLLVSVMLFGRRARAMLSCLRFQARIKAVLPGLGAERLALFQSMMAVHREQEDVAIQTLDGLGENAAPEVQTAARWMRALSALHYLRRERRVVSSSLERFPQVMALMYSHGPRRVPVRPQTVGKELAEISSTDLDRLARGYIELIDVLIPALGNPSHPFHAQAEDSLEFMTGRLYFLNAQERFTQWWKEFKPVLCRGGGALLVSVRLLQREYYHDQVTMLDRLSKDGLLSAETETVHRVGAFFGLLNRTHLRLTSQEIPRFFRDLHYHGAVEMGLLRYPTAEQHRGILDCCRRGKDMREAKKRFIADALALWAKFGDELAPHLATLLKRLLDLRGRKCPARLSYWQQQWRTRENDFEQFEMLLMDGIAATADGQYSAARKLFERASDLNHANSTPWVNQAYLCMLTGKERQARETAVEIVRQFPNDSGAFLAMGRLFAAHLEDIEEAERLFRMARELDKTNIEPLILLGEVKLMEGRYAESQAYFDTAKQIDPSSLESKLGLARTYMEIKRYDLAVENLLAVAREGNGDIMHLAHYHLYRTFREMKDDRRAFEYLDQVPTYFFKEPDELDDIALHLETEKQYAKARTYSERAMLLRARGLGTDGIEPSTADSV